MRPSARCLFALLALSPVLSAAAQSAPAPAATPAAHPAESIDLPSSKQLFEPVPGSPQKLNSLPMAMAWSPDKRYLAIVNAGFGTFESDYQQSIAVLDTNTGTLVDFPEKRTAASMPQTLYSGIAFSADGRHLYASLDSLSDPEGKQSGATGNAIAVYAFADGTIQPERTIAIPLQTLAPGRTQNQIGKPVPAGVAIPVPTGLAVLHTGGSEQLLVADNYSDDVLQLDSASGKVLHRFDLAANAIVPSTYPIAVTVSPDQHFAYVALWNGSAITALDLRTGKVGATLPLLPPTSATGPSSHPTAFAFSPSGSTLYVALANRDTVAVVHVQDKRLKLEGLLDTRLPGQGFFGAIPASLAVSADGRQLYAANAGSNNVAVFDVNALPATKTAVHATGFIPTEWFPTALEVKDNELYIATAKGKGTGPNAQPQHLPAHPAAVARRMKRPHTYIATLLYGSLASVDLRAANRDLPSLSAAVVASNRISAEHQHLQFADSAHPDAHPIKHVIYIIKENRTYDQVFGDLGVGDGDKSLTMYGESITPNLHKLARQFGVLDNFYDSGEVSGDGHVWSTAGITSDYTEKVWQQSYRGKERQYDFEGVVEEGYPLAEGISDINEPDSSYLWTDLAAHGKSLYHFGEFVSTKFCDDSGEAPKDPSPLSGTPEPPPVHCAKGVIRAGDDVPATYGGGRSPYPWNIPLIYKNFATKPELSGHFDPEFPDFNLKFPDQLRVEEFLTHFRGWQKDRDAGHDTMPAFIMLRLPNDHTAGTSVGSPTPRASVADNDLAVGRAVEAIAHSRYWDDTAFFILEDDAQDGADHVDAHRSLALVVSRYAPRAEKPVVDHHFYTTVSVLRTIEDLLDIPPMNSNDAFAPLIQPLFAGSGDQPPFSADYANRDNHLIYQANTAQSPGAKESSRMDFTHEDRADARRLNVILWRDAMGSTPVPWMVLHPHAGKADKKDDDD